MGVKNDHNQSEDSSINELLVSEMRYRRLFESARDGILILDAVTCKITDVNPFMTELLGYTRVEFLGKELWEIGLLKDEKTSRDAFRELQKNHYIRYEDLPLETKDGASRQVEFISNVYTENERQVIQCNIRDITERKNHERNSANLAAIVASSHDAIISNNFDGTILTWNEAAEKIFGYSAKEIIGQNILILFPAELVHEERKILENIKRGGHISNFETTRLKKDGTTISVSLIHSPIKNSTGEIVAVSKIAHDITARKLSNSALEISETRFKQLIDSSIIGIIISQINGTVVEANNVFLEMIGYDREDLAKGNIRWDEMTSPEQRWKNDRAIAELQESGTSKTHEKEYIRKNGSRVSVLVGGSLLIGSTDTMIAFVLDIT